VRMACRAPDTFYVAEQLRDITKCSSKQAEELLAVSKNDLMLAVEKFFAQEVEVEEEKPGDRRKVDAGGNRDIVRADDVMNVRKKHRYDVTKAGDAEDIITTRPRLRKKSIKKFAIENKLSFEDMNSEEDLMDEVIAISIAEAYPELDQDSIRVMVRHFRGRQEELLKYVESQVKSSKGKVVNERRSYSLMEIKYDSFHMQEFSEFETVREEFLRMTGNKNLKVLAIDIVENKNLEEKFEIQKAVFKAEGLSDLPVLLIAYTDIVDVEQVLESNFQLSLIKIGATNTIGVHFSETPQVNISTREQSCLLMCLVLEGPPLGIYGPGNVVVTNVDQILPKYVVHFCSQEEDGNPSTYGQLRLDFDEELRCRGRLGGLRI